MAVNFSALYTKFGKPLLKFLVKRYNLELETAEEIAQEAWLAAFKSYNTFNNKSTFFTWVCKIAMFKTADYYRKFVNRRSGLVSPTLEHLNNLIDPQVTPEEFASLEDMSFKIRDCLNLLPEKYKMVLWLRYYKQYSYSEMAKELNMSERAVEGTLYRAKKQFLDLAIEAEITL